jgi:hypothetical protein
MILKVLNTNFKKFFRPTAVNFNYLKILHLVLSDKAKRSNYDNYGTEDPVEVDLDDFFEHFHFDDMMSMMMNDVKSKK